MSRIWLLMILIGMVCCMITNDYQIIEQVFMNVGKDTLDFVIPLMCNIVFFNGILYIAKEANILKMVAKAMNPLLRKIFVDLDQDDLAFEYISSNIIINMFGLGSAATPSGLLAMKELQKNNPNKEEATRSMVTFLVLNTAGVTLFPTAVLALRASFHAKEVSNFWPYAMITTIITCILAVFIDHWRNYRD